MNKKAQQQAAASMAFNRNVKDDWEIIASEQFDENKKLLERVIELEGEARRNNDILNIDPKKCKNWKYSDRNDFEMGDIEDLAEDIRNNGQLQPAIVRKINTDVNCDYEIIAGERRWRACLLANIPLSAMITEQDDANCLVIQTSENKKKSLSSYSLAVVYQRMMKDLGISQNELSLKLGIPKSSFGDLMSFNKVPNEVWKAVGDMTNVKPKTAAYISMICSKGDEYINAVLRVADKIKDGVGVDNLGKVIDKYFSNIKSKRNSSKAYENKNGEMIFRITSKGRISLPQTILKKLNIDDLAKFLEEYIEANI